MANDEEVGEMQRESVFREHWRVRQSESGRPGELIEQPGWIDAGLYALGILLAAGSFAAATGTVARTETLPAALQGTTVSATRTGEAAPRQGDKLKFHDPAGATETAVVVEVTATEVRAELRSPGPATAVGVLDVPAGRHGLLSALFARWW